MSSTSNATVLPLHEPTTATSALPEPSSSLGDRRSVIGAVALSLALLTSTFFGLPGAFILHVWCVATLLLVFTLHRSAHWRLPSLLVHALFLLCLWVASSMDYVEEFLRRSSGRGDLSVLGAWLFDARQLVGDFEGSGIDGFYVLFVGACLTLLFGRLLSMRGGER